MTTSTTVPTLGPPAIIDHNPIVLILTGLLSLATSLITGLASLLFRLVAFATLTLPTWLFTLFSMSLTFTMNFTTILLIILAFMSAAVWLIRYRFLNVYARLPQDPPRQQPHIELFPDSQDGDSKPGLSNYLDEFFSAIKVFGYLERHVFHELTRTMQTRKLMAGETLLLEEEKGFSLVVDGVVQIFVKSLRLDASDLNASCDSEDSYREGNQGYQLLTEVKNGASMSSLFSILSLFTEDVRLRHDDSSIRPGTGVSLTPESTAATPAMTNPPTPAFPSAESGLFSDGYGNAMNPRLARVPPLSLEPAFDEQTAAKEGRKPRRRESAHPDLVARATVDSTIAIIPASAFRRLTRVYPRATAHIVQVILARLQRVTFSTAHQYLGLTSELLQIEKLMNKYTSYDLPAHLRGSALDRLRDQFAKERERLGEEDITKGIALHNPVSLRMRRSSSSLRKEAAVTSMLSTSRAGSGAPDGNRRISSSSRNTSISPGDLAAAVQPSHTLPRSSRSSLSQATRKETEAAEIRLRSAASPLPRNEPATFHQGLENGPVHRQDSITENELFRESVLQSMIKALGIVENAKENPRKGGTSVEQSPRMVSYDAKRQTAVFNNAFGFIDPYEGSADGESESISTSLASLSHGRTLREELINEIEIVFFPKGSVLVEQGERNPGLYYVIDGFLDVAIPVEEKDSRKRFPGSPQDTNSFSDAFPQLRRSKTGSRAQSMPGHGRDYRRHSHKSLFLVKPGGIAGYIGTMSSSRSFTDVTAKTDVYVGFLPRAALERAAEKFPVVLLTMAKRLTSLIPRLILHIDFALEWVQVNAGQVMFHQGDESDAIYIVLNGRLRSVRELGDGTMKVTGEYGQGESIGELEVMTEDTRPATLHAIRETELAKLPRSLFDSLAQEHPSITIQLSKIIASRMRELVEEHGNERHQERKHAALSDSSTSTLNLRTIAILPVRAGVPVSDFGSRLLAALTQVGIPSGVTLLNQANVLNHLGRHAFSRMGRLKLSQYLADLEEKYGMVLYVADTSVNALWTQTCITQADCILLVGLAEDSPSIGEYERFLLGMQMTSRKELVLLHSERYCPPGLTRRWLQNRMWINGSHHHIQMAYRASVEATPLSQPRRIGTAIRHRVQVLQAEIQKYTSRRVRQTPIYSADTPFKGDFHRLARRLCGKSVGLVLGGGGARGIAHVGIIRAMEEAGIPVDIIGGTSIGAFMGALLARDGDVVPMYGHAKKFAGRMGSMWRFALDLTYPSSSYTTGHEFNRGIFKTFGDSQIEDFWLQFYCNTTNISKSRPEIHTSGYAWRYVRASMSLAGLIPPMCDNGNMLLDGGYIDNLTTAHMKNLGADLVFAVDVGSEDDNTPQSFGDSLSGIWTLFNRWNPFSTTPNPPTLSDIQARLAYVSSVDALERAKTTPGVLYMRPPIEAYGTLEFGRFDEIYAVGYSYGKEYLARLKMEGELKALGLGGWEYDSEESKGLRRTMAPRRASI
ncbi:hypothetical protein DV738_g687, partial [Chaetothyriales sp. CBS 135597]